MTTKKKMTLAPAILVICCILVSMSVRTDAQQQPQQQQMSAEQQAVLLLHELFKANTALPQMFEVLLQKAKSIPNNVTDTSQSGITMNPLFNILLMGIKGFGKSTATPATVLNTNQNMTGQPPEIDSAGMAVEAQQSALVMDALKVVMEEIQKGKIVAEANNVTVGGDFTSLLGLIDPLTVMQRFISSHSANDFLPNGPINAQCHRDVIDSLDAIVAPKAWAIEMFDASGKPTSGVERGSFYFVGSYDQCYQIRPSIMKGEVLGNRTQSESRQFGTRFCRADIDIPDTLIESLNVDTRGVRLKLIWGLCVPDSCHKDDIKGIFDQNTVKRLNIPIESVYCYEDTDLSSDTSAVVAITILSFFGLLIVVGTMYDICKTNSSVHTKAKRENADTVKKYDQLNGNLNNAYVVETTSTVHAIKDSANGIPASYMPHQETSHTLKSPVFKTGENIIPIENGSAGHAVNNSVNQGSPKRRETLIARIVLCFSLYTNVPKILKAKSAPGSVSCVHGIRFLSMTWVVLGHTYNYGIISQDETFTAGNLLDFVPILQRFTYQGVIAGGFAVDTFFVLSAFLMTWLQLKDISKRTKKCTVPYGVMFYFHRFWRLTPIYMMVIMSFACLYRYIGSGPFWPSTITSAENCKSTWWTNMLYINNLVEVDDQCMDWTWYLANDMQFYVISPILLTTMYMSTKAGISLTGILMVAGMASSFWKEHIYNGNFFTMKSDGGDYWHKVYTVPWCRVSCWTVGMFLGLLFYKRGRRPIRSKVVVWLGWILATGVALFLVYSPYTENKEGGSEWTRVERSFYESFGRPMWGLCVAWVVFACYTGCGGLVNSFLSWNGFIPLSRLTYAAYLVHPICMMVYVFSRRTLFYVNDYNIVYLYFGHLGITYMVAFVCSLAFEAPFMSLEKVLFRGGGR